MKHIKTIYLGCDNTGARASIDNYVIKFERQTAKAHATYISKFCPILWQIQNLYEDGVVKDPVKICVLLPSNLVGKKVSDNNENTYDGHLIWFMENFLPPTPGVIFSLYSFDIATSVQTMWTTKVIWPLQDRWKAKRDGEYITCQKYSPISASAKYHGYYDMFVSSSQAPVIDNIEALCDLPVKFIDYSMHEDKLFEVLSHSKMHFTYHGATYFSAALIDLPTVCYGFPKNRVTTNALQGELMDASSWGDEHGTGFTNIGLYNDSNGKVYNGWQTYVKHANSPLELEGYLKGIPVTINKKEYSIYD